MLNKNSIFVLTTIGIGIILWLLLSIKVMLVYFGIMCGLMFFNITLSTMTNVLSGAMVERNDTFWRIIMILLCSVFLATGIII